MLLAKRFFLFVLTFVCANLRSEVYDCFTFFNELVLLEIRLEELYDVVDHFVIVEGTQTYTGKDKPLYFSENREMFRKYDDKITHIVVDKFSEPTHDALKDHWDREALSRNRVMDGLIHAKPDDIIFLSDVDEIPSKNAVLEIKKYFNRFPSKRKLPINKLICNLHMRLFMFMLNRENPMGWSGGSKATPFWVFKQYNPWEFKLLHQKHPDLHPIKNGGWHFNTMGGKRACVIKWLATGPLFSNEPFLLSLLENEDAMEKTYHDQANSQTAPIPVDSTFPRYLLENLDYYRSIGWIEEGY